MISTELLSKAVYERMHAEQQTFRKELLAMKPEDILDQAYVYAVREDILCAMENTELSMRQAYALLATETPLAQVYKTYLGKDTPAQKRRRRYHTCGQGIGKDIRDDNDRLHSALA